jgi:hypothetical protein
METISRRDNSESETDFAFMEPPRFPLRPDKAQVQEIIAKSKTLYRERLAKAVRRRRRTSDQLVAPFS